MPQFRLRLVDGAVQRRVVETSGLSRWITERPDQELAGGAWA